MSVNCPAGFHAGIARLGTSRLIGLLTHASTFAVRLLADSLRSVGGEVTISQVERLLAGGSPLVLGPTPDHLPDEVALGVYTSGSTGKPKLVGLTAANLIASADASLHRLGAPTGSTWSVKLPLHHVAGIQVLIRAIRNHGEIVADNADYTSIVPTQLVQALAGSALLAELQHAKAVLVGGGRIDASLLVKAKGAGINVVTTYGMSETAGGCVYDGTALDGVTCEVVDGRIRIRGPVVALGYLNDQKATEEHFVDGWFITNDRGELRNGKLTVLGRLDDVIVSGGENISLVEVEERLLSHPAITDVICVGIEDAEWGERLVAAVTTSSDVSLQELREFMSDQRFAAPRDIRVLSSLPRTELGKPNRDAVRKLFA